MAHNRCDFYNGNERCANKIYREVIYSKSGKKMKKGWQNFYSHELNVYCEREKVKLFNEHIFPRDTVFSHLCRKHFKQEKSKLLGWC